MPQDDDYDEDEDDEEGDDDEEAAAAAAAGTKVRAVARGLLGGTGGGAVACDALEDWGRGRSLRSRLRWALRCSRRTALLGAWCSRPAATQ